MIGGKIRVDEMIRMVTRAPRVLHDRDRGDTCPRCVTLLYIDAVLHVYRPPMSVTVTRYLSCDAIPCHVILCRVLTLL